MNRSIQSLLRDIQIARAAAVKRANAKAEIRAEESAKGAAQLRAPDGPKVHAPASLESILGTAFIRS